MVPKSPGPPCATGTRFNEQLCRRHSRSLKQSTPRAPWVVLISYKFLNQWFGADSAKSQHKKPQLTGITVAACSCRAALRVCLQCPSLWALHGASGLSGLDQSCILMHVVLVWCCTDTHSEPYQPLHISLSSTNNEEKPRAPLALHQDPTILTFQAELKAGTPESHRENMVCIGLLYQVLSLH